MRRIWPGFLLTLGLAAGTDLPLYGQEDRPRARDLGIAPGVFLPGPLNAITDVPGVRVGHFTLVEGDDIRTGATAIIPHGGNIFQEKVPAAVVVGNGFGKLIGSTQVKELGQLETPVILTNTLNVWEAAASIVDYMLALPGNERIGSINPVVGETNDGFLSNIRERPLRPEPFLQALSAARNGAVEEGSVGAGTGTTAFGFSGDIKAGIGTASRRAEPEWGGYTVGVLVQSNFGGILTMDGVPVGRELGSYDYQDVPADYPVERPSGGSCMNVVATDAPLDAKQLERLGWRAFAGMARTGATFQAGSGDYVIACSVAESVRIPYGGSASAGELTRKVELVPYNKLSPLFQMVAEATEEAIYNSVLRSTTVRGFRNRESRALPIDELELILAKYNRGIGASRLTPP
jgi:D-aminopeptidase